MIFSSLLQSTSLIMGTLHLKKLLSMYTQSELNVLCYIFMCSFLAQKVLLFLTVSITAAVRSQGTANFR